MSSIMKTPTTDRPCFSPSQTSRYLECPEKWRLHRQGLRVIDDETDGSASEWGLERGTIVHELLDNAFSELIGSSAGDVHEHLKISEPSIFTRLQQRFPLATHAHIEQEAKGIARALKAFTKFELLNEWIVIANELDFGIEYGRSRADLIVERRGVPGIIDFKTKSFKNPLWRTQFLDDVENDWQFFHYVWASRLCGMPVEWYGVVVLEPNAVRTPIVYRDYTVNERFLSRWEENAKIVWQQMQDCIDGKMTPVMISEHRGKYGVCEYKRRCFGSIADLEMYYTNILRPL